MAIDDNYTKVLLHMDGTDASTTFTDESGKTWTAQNSAQLDTAQKVFGTASGMFEKDTVDYITTPDHADFDFGAGDFTLDLRVRFETLASTMVLVAQREGSFYSPWSLLISSGEIYFLSSANGTSWGVLLQWTHGVAIVINTWYHMAFVRYGNLWSYFLNGVSKVNTTVSQTVMSSIVTPSVGAASEGANPLDGWIDEYRVSKGIARWTSDFTPPTKAYYPLGAQVMIFS